MKYLLATIILVVVIVTLIWAVFMVDKIDHQTSGRTNAVNTLIDKVK